MRIFTALCLVSILLVAVQALNKGNPTEPDPLKRLYVWFVNWRISVQTTSLVMLCHGLG